MGFRTFQLNPSDHRLSRSWNTSSPLIRHRPTRQRLPPWFEHSFLRNTIYISIIFYCSYLNVVTFHFQFWLDEPERGNLVTRLTRFLLPCRLKTQKGPSLLHWSPVIEYWGPDPITLRHFEPDHSTILFLTILTKNCTKQEKFYILRIWKIKQICKSLFSRS